MVRVTILLGAGAVYDASLEMNSDGLPVTTDFITRAMYTHGNSSILFHIPEYATSWRIIRAMRGAGGELGSNFEDYFGTLLKALLCVNGMGDDPEGKVRGVMYEAGLDLDGMGQDDASEEIQRLMYHVLKQIHLSINAYCPTKGEVREDVPDWYGRFFGRLEEENGSGMWFDIVDLNYDNLVEECIHCEDGFVEGDDPYHEYKVFDASRVTGISECNRLHHIHGHIRLGFPPGQQRGGLCYWKTGITDGAPGNHFVFGGEGGPYILSPIVTGTEKERFFIFEPFKTYNSNLKGPMGENDALLVVGYGFGDEHVNSMVSRYGKGSGKRLVVICPWNGYVERKIEEVCGHTFPMDQVCTVSDDGMAVWAMGGFKDVANDPWFVNALMEYLKGEEVDWSSIRFLK